MPQPEILVTPHRVPIEVVLPGLAPEKVELIALGGRGPQGEFNPVDKAKLDGIAAGATANATDAQLRDRTTHTGMQAISTVTGLQTALDAKAPSGHSHADATGSVAGFMPAADKAKLDGIAAGATANATDAQLRDRATHTGMQAISTVTSLQTTLDAKADLVAGKVPSAQLPSFVDDVLEYANLAAFPGTGEAGKIYVPLDTNKTYRWSGSAYVEISASPGTTDALTEGASNLYHTAARVNALISAAVGSVVQAYSATLALLAALTTTTFGRAMLTLADAAALRTTVALPTSTTAGRLARYTDTAGAQGQTSKIYEDATGKVGIGTTSPTVGLHLYDVASGRIRIENSSNADVGLSFVNSAKHLSFSMNSSGDFYLNDATLTVTRLYFYNGRLGVGDYYASSNLPQAGISTPGTIAIGFATSATLSYASGCVGMFNGNIGVGGLTSGVTAPIDNGGDTYRQRTTRTPASAAAAGNTGDICWDAGYVYVCVATNTWKRAAIATW